MSTALAAAPRAEAPEPSEPSDEVLVLAPLALEARAVRGGAPWAEVRRVGMGPKRAARSAALSASGGNRPILIAGFCGALDPTLEPGDIVLASELRGPTGTSQCDDPSILAGVLRRGGLRVHIGPIASSQRLVVGERRWALYRSGALAVDMESAWLAPAARRRPLVTLRVVLDTNRRELHRPLGTITGAAIAYRRLRRACSLVEDWARALGSREVVLASPRASCAGVERAVEMVERVLDDRGAPVYVRKQIVHNAHVVEALKQRGAIFVDELSQVPPGQIVIFSAHGVSPAVRLEARQRGLEVIDATCPLVAKVHAEARRFAAAGFDIVLVGHAGHEEVEGTLGEAPDRIQVVARPDEIASVTVADPERVAYLSQTTLAVDDTEQVVGVLRARFPRVAGPASSDICYATQNRQDAVRALAQDCDLILVVGSPNSSNSQRLVEVAERAGCRARLIDDATQIPPAILRGARRIGVTAGASAPEQLVERVINAIGGLGPVTVSERSVATETVQFKLPPELRLRPDGEQKPTAVGEQAGAGAAAGVAGGV
ncbi:MAG: 4-hydroxy-3-methylbut-2-enyl diphosphate reductase [Actinomycetota bacterium]|nr:4-hydroxy-3-methylbut-2-enyl diphosphate reductase [Actinomycetota bacterium]